MDINSPIDFLNLFNDMDVVQSGEDSKYTLFRYKPKHNLMVYDMENSEFYIHYYEIWEVLEEYFNLKFSESQELTKEWLSKAYNLTGVTTSIFLLPSIKNVFIEKLKSEGVLFKKVDKTMNPKFNTIKLKNYITESIVAKVEKNKVRSHPDFGKWFLKHNDGSYKVKAIESTQNFLNKAQNKNPNIPFRNLYFLKFSPIKQVCLRASTNTSSPTTQQEPTQQEPTQQEPSKPTPMKQQCGFDLNWVQTEPTEGNNFVMYEMDGINTNNTTGLFKVQCQGFKVPDLFYIKYGESEWMSTFKGYHELSKRNYSSELLNIRSNVRTKIDEKIAQLGGKLKCGDSNLTIDTRTSFETNFINKNQNDTLKIIVFSPLGGELPQSFTVNLICTK